MSFVIPGVRVPRDAAGGIRLAQVLHHRTDHRSQICTILTSLGIAPPDIDVWAVSTRAARGKSPRPPSPWRRCKVAPVTRIATGRDATGSGVP
jgi:hypothetical protein